MHSTLTVLLAAATLAACGAPPPPAPLAPPPEPEPLLTSASVLQWTPDGDLVIDARWHLDIDTATFAPLAPKEGKGTPALSPTNLAAVFEPGLLTVLGGRQVKVPSFFDPPAPGLPLTGFWLDKNRVYLHAWHPEHKQAACRVFDLAQNGFTTPTECVNGDHPEITRLQKGPGDLLAVHTQDGETRGLRILRYTPETGMRPLTIAPIDLRPSGSIIVGFQADGATAALVSDCQLDQPRPCSAPPPADGRHGLYILDLATGKLSGRLVAVAPGTAPAPDGRRLAWVRGDQICVGSPRTPGATWCHRPPQ